MIRLFSGNNTHSAEIDGLVNQSDGAYINDAAVSVTVYESDGETAVAGTWPVTLTASGSGGGYSETFNANAGIEAGKRYVVIYSVTSGVNRAEFERSIVAEKRRF